VKHKAVANSEVLANAILASHLQDVIIPDPLWSADRALRNTLADDIIELRSAQHRQNHDDILD